ncbi:MAG: hypothetical protein RLZZ242_620 [Bacteroidota bacterium]|jgi:2-succinyl-5-enolpyruvyl-6-hydroxy-3-cyclohexene-1-carboxylate synthase
MYSAIPSAFLLVQLLKRFGIHQVVISPGSRNAPLIATIAADASFKTFSIVDERSAAFFALGRAQASQVPVALLCTSGSALLNYYPAIAEAFYSQIPLLVLSADRPSYKIDIGDGQTIRQQNIFASLLGPSFNLLQDVSHNTSEIKRFAPELLEHDQETVQRLNTEIIATAINHLFGQRIPVHVNIPFEEPLYESVLSHSFVVSELPPLSQTQANPPLSLNSLEPLREVFQGTLKKVLLLIGVWNPTTDELKALETVIGHLGALVFTESTSNVPEILAIDAIDALLAPLERHTKSEELFEKLQPDIVFTLGGLVVSKKIKALLRKKEGLVHIHLGQQRALDTFGALKYNFGLDALAQYSETLTGQSDFSYRDYWYKYYQSLTPKREAFAHRAPYSDFKVFEQLASAIPESYVVHFANSSAIRYAQFFKSKAKKQWCNRGTSGIEGSTSTAVGYASYNGEHTLLVTGDLSLFYDSNALWNAYIPRTFRVIVVNNFGGGIFRILPKAKQTKGFEEFLETRHQRKAELMAHEFGLEYAAAHTRLELASALKDFFEPNDRPKLLEIFTPSSQNEKVLFDYFDALL